MAVYKVSKSSYRIATQMRCHQQLQHQPRIKSHINILMMASIRLVAPETDKVANTTVARLSIVIIAFLPTTPSSTATVAIITTTIIIIIIVVVVVAIVVVQVVVVVTKVFVQPFHLLI